MTKLLARHGKGALATLAVLGALAIPASASAAPSGGGKVQGISTAQTALLEHSPFYFDIGRRFH